MKHSSIPLCLFVIGCLFGGVAGYVIALNNVDSLPLHEHRSSHTRVQNSAQHHNHDMPRNISAEYAPRLDIEVLADPVSGYTVLLEVQNFNLAPEKIDQEHQEGEGHAHIYVDGEKIARFASLSYHLGALSLGKHEVSVTLNGNDHRPLAIDDRLIEARKTVHVIQ